MPTPKTYLACVEAAVVALKEADGSSRQAITKYIKANFQKDDAAALRRALKKGVADGKLVQAGARFKVAGVEFEAAEVPQVTIKDIVEGEGPAAASGDTVIMKYKGTLDDGSVFDQGSKFAFQLDAGEVIKGWDIGVKGMKKGGKRKLHVPASLGYGKRGALPEIPPNSDLHFTVVCQQISS
jgi:FKBP-type peptidyl-prolyl cis-trans isomerase